MQNRDMEEIRTGTSHVGEGSIGAALGHAGTVEEALVDLGGVGDG